MRNKTIGQNACGRKLPARVSHADAGQPHCTSDRKTGWIVAMRLFVYGTLRRGEVGHALLGGARLLGEATTEPAFTLLDMGEYPAIVEGGTTAVAGELYEVGEAVLRELDRYEDVPELYLRVERAIAGEPAVIYVLRPEHARGYAAIASGDWRQHRSDRP
jgi:gamma-glutamylcyclotransferase (GGCT)/AIG2-like uncharacterized protein YtfP